MNAVTNKDGIKTITTHYIDGAFVESHGRELMDIIRPTDGQVIARVTMADEKDTRRAIAMAKRAFATYGRSTKEERAKMLRHLHEAASARLYDLIVAMVEEYGANPGHWCARTSIDSQRANGTLAGRRQCELPISLSSTSHVTTAAVDDHLCRHAPPACEPGRASQGADLSCRAHK